MNRIGQEGPVINALRTSLPGYVVDSWETNFPDLQAAIGTKSGVMNIFSIIILVIAGIGILNLLLMAVYERTREIGLLGALGLKPRQISILFLLEGALMGVVGIVFGIALGLVFNFLFQRVGFDYSQFSNADRLHRPDQREGVPNPGAGKNCVPNRDGADHRHAGSSLPRPRGVQERARRSPAFRVRSTMIQLYKMAFRDLGRNRRRSFFSALALAMGLALLLLIASVVNGEMRGALESSIKLNSGHLQVRGNHLRRK